MAKSRHGPLADASMKFGVEELRGTLRLRRAEPGTAVTAAGARPLQVEARLRAIESEGRMPTKGAAGGPRWCPVTVWRARRLAGGRTGETPERMVSCAAAGTQHPAAVVGWVPRTARVVQVTLVQLLAAGRRPRGRGIPRRGRCRGVAVDGVGVVPAPGDDRTDERGQRLPGNAEPVGPRCPVAVVAHQRLADIESHSSDHAGTLRAPLGRRAAVACRGPGGELYRRGKAGPHPRDTGHQEAVRVPASSSWRCFRFSNAVMTSHANSSGHGVLECQR